MKKTFFFQPLKMFLLGKLKRLTLDIREDTYVSFLLVSCVHKPFHLARNIYSLHEIDAGF